MARQHKVATIEERLYEAYRKGEGVRLSYKQLVDLLLLDDALRTRITNAAATEAGVNEPGYDEMPDDNRTWRQFVKHFEVT